MGVLIIGTGLAGYTVAREVRKHDDAIGITLVTADDGHNYSKPMLSNGFAKGKSADGLRQQSAEQMAEALGVTVRTHTRVTGIDTAAKRVRTDTDALDYDQLVLAVGAKQLVLPLDGDAADDVMRVNTLGEYAHFRNQIEGASRVAIMGPGLIGCEFANDLANGGFQCDVIGPDNHPLERLMPEPAGRALQGALAALGVQFHLGTVVNAVNQDGEAYRVSLANGSEILADAVLSAVGLVPDIELAREAGLETARGIRVNRELATSADGVYALGDCVEIDGLVMPYVMPIMHAARALGATLTGTPTAVTMPAMPVAVKTPAHPVVVAPPAPGAEGTWQCESQEDGGVLARHVAADGSLLGVALTGSMAVKQKMALQRELPPVLS